MASTYYTRLDDTRFRPTAHVGGAWRADERALRPGRRV